MKNQMKTFWFIKFHTKLWLAQSPCVLGSINKWVYLGPDFICYRIRYLTGVKSGNTYVFSHYYRKIKVHSYDFLLIEKVMTLHSVIILIKSVLNKDQINYYYNVFFKKC